MGEEFSNEIFERREARSSSRFVGHPSPEIRLDDDYPLHKHWNASPAQSMTLLAEQPQTTFMGIENPKNSVGMH